jgi:cytochrome c oxidase subunit 2
MEKLIILIVIILGAIALAQLIRVYELSSKLRKSGEHEINNKDNHINGLLMFVFMILTFVGFFYLMLKYGWTGRGTAASTQGVETDWLLNLNFIIILIAYFITNFLLFYFSYKYVRKPGVKAYFYPHNNKLEMIWTIVPAIVLAVIIILGLKSWTKITSPAEADAIRIELFAKQYAWTARYAGLDNELGKYDYKLTTDNNELALITSNTIDSSIAIMSKEILSLTKLLNNRDTILNDSVIVVRKNTLSVKERLFRLVTQIKENHDKKADAAVWDDIIQNDTLYLCKGENYEFNLRARDVLHSAYFPHFRIQMNAVPGMTTRMKLTPNMTTEQMRAEKNNPNFNFVLMCNKICGGAHYKMKMIVVVKDKASYKKWMAQKNKETFKMKYFPAAEIATPKDSLIIKPLI